MARLNIERQKNLEPKRINFCLQELEKLKLEVKQVTSTRIDFVFNNNVIQFFPYSGWFSGKGVKSGRGWEKLKLKLQLQ